MDQPDKTRSLTVKRKEKFPTRHQVPWHAPECSKRVVGKIRKPPCQDYIQGICWLALSCCQLLPGKRCRQTQPIPDQIQSGAPKAREYGSGPIATESPHKEVNNDNRQLLVYPSTLRTAHCTDDDDEPRGSCSSHCCCFAAFCSR